MLDWIFGSSKDQKKPQSTTKSEEKPEDKLGQDEEWVYDFVKQYLISPIWKNPLLDFVEENCAIFDDSQENKFQYTKIFQQFTSLCAILVESIVEEIGISFKTLEKCIIKGMKKPKDARIFNQILICDNFESFKRIMIAKNKELETQALRKIRDDSKKGDEAQDKIDEMELEKLELEKAIALSLALSQKVEKTEEEELQDAIRLSKITQKQQAQKEPVKPAGKSLLGDLPPLMTAAKNPGLSHKGYVEEKAKLEIELKQLKTEKKEDEQSAQVRKKRLDQQRELLRKKKQQERSKQLKTFVENKESTSIPEHVVSEEEMVKRRKLMERLKNQLNSD